MYVSALSHRKRMTCRKNQYFLALFSLWNNKEKREKNPVTLTLYKKLYWIPLKYPPALLDPKHNIQENKTTTTKTLKSLKSKRIFAFYILSSFIIFFIVYLNAWIYNIYNTFNYTYVYTYTLYHKPYIY